MKGLKIGMMALALVAFMGSAAQADVALDFGSGAYAGGVGSTQTPDLTGTLTSIDIAFDYVTNPTDGSWASDFELVIGGDDFWGGFDNALGGITDNGPWSFDGSGSAGSGPYADSVMGLSIPLSGPTDIAIGNGWTLSDGVEYNNVSVLLKGVDVVPEPGTLALFGMGVLVLIRRRR